MSDLGVIGKQIQTAAQYSDLADVPSGLEWLANEEQQAQVVEPDRSSGDAPGPKSFLASGGKAARPELRQEQHRRSWL
jgi:hypothetical protein